jgi:hypothetical protein
VAHLAGDGDAGDRGDYVRDPIVFHVLCRDSIAFCFISRDLIAFYFYRAWLNSYGIPNRILTQLVRPTKHNTEKHICA